MKLYVFIRLCTDGDFYLDKNFKYEEDTTRDWEDYCIRKCFKDIEPLHNSWKPENWMRYQAKLFLEETLISLRFTTNHYYLMGDLCEFFDKAIRKVNSLGIGEYYEDYIWGNYEGTTIALSCVKE